MSDISCELISFLRTIYASNNWLISKFLGLNEGNNNKLMYSMKLYYEYIYNYELNKWIDEVDLINSYMDSSFNVQVDVLKILMPSAYYINCNNIGQIDKILGILNYKGILNKNSFCFSSDIFQPSIKLENIICVS